MPHVAGNRERLHAIARRAMRQRGLEPDFGPEARTQTEATARQADGNSTLRDLRQLLWCSIDNDDSRDLDQLSVMDGEKVLVAIADVDAAVEPSSPLDDHARTNTTSVYTAGGVFPMLPDKLSTDITSLNLDVERLAVVVEFTTD